MCDEITIGKKTVDTIRELRAAMPTAEIIKSSHYMALPPDDSCLCGVDICATLVQAGCDYDYEPGSGRWSVRPDGSVANTKITARDCSAADWCRLNGWGVGTILEGDEGRGPERIVITAVGEESILAKLLGDPACGDRSWVLWCRDWKRVG